MVAVTPAMWRGAGSLGKRRRGFVPWRKSKERLCVRPFTMSLHLAESKACFCVIEFLGWIRIRSFTASPGMPPIDGSSSSCLTMATQMLFCAKVSFFFLDDASVGGPQKERRSRSSSKTCTLFVLSYRPLLGALGFTIPPLSGP